MTSIRTQSYIIDKLLSTNIITEPFPHIIIDNFLDKKTLKQVKKLFTINDIIDEFNYNKLIYNLINSPKYKTISNLESIVDFFISNVFSNHIFKIFMKYVSTNNSYSLKNYIEKNTNNIEKKTNNIEKNTNNIDLNLRFRNRIPYRDYPYNPQYYLLPPHLDNSHEIINCMLYIKDQNLDKKTGGDLLLFSKKTNVIEPVFKRFYNDQELILNKTIEYIDNRFIAFLNTPQSYHAVSYKDTSLFPRNNINISYSKS